MKRTCMALTMVAAIFAALIGCCIAGPTEARASGAGISGSFYRDGDPDTEWWFELHADLTGIQYVGKHWFEFTYEISGDRIVCKYSSYGESGGLELIILDENRLQYDLTGGILAPDVYVRLEGVTDDQLRRRPGEDYWDWYNRLPYSEQMRVLEEEWEMNEQWRKESEARAAAEAAAQAAKPITLKVNGVTVKTDSPPVIETGRTLAPMRAVVEALGYIVSWDSAAQTAEIYDPDTHDLRISLAIGSKKAKVSTGIYGVMDERILDVPAKLINGRTMVPVRFIAETLGCQVSWDEAAKTVSIVQVAG